MSAPLCFRVEPSEAGRIDKIIAARFPAAPRAEIVRLFRRGSVRVAGAVAAKGRRARPNELVELAEAPPTRDDLIPSPEGAPAVTFVYEDDDVLALSKPAGVPSHPLRAGENNTAANAVVARAPVTAGVGRDPREAGLIHRLDTGTSGLLVAAKHDRAWGALRRALSTEAAEKTYLAVVRGELSDRGVADTPLAQRGGVARVDPRRGLGARTEWEILARAGDCALVRCVARTGRMHQVRAHLAHAGAPIVGDARYGGAEGRAIGLIDHFLHAQSMRAPHPAPGAPPLDLFAPLPADRQRALEALGLPPPPAPARR